MTTSTTTTSIEYDCEVGVASAWTELKRKWCCAEKGVECPKFDCKFGPAKGFYWPADEKAWCCEHKNLGCELTTHTTTHTTTMHTTTTHTKATTTKTTTTTSQTTTTTAKSTTTKTSAKTKPTEELTDDIAFHFKLYRSINCLSGVRGGLSEPNDWRLEGDDLLRECQHQCLLSEQCNGIVSRNEEGETDSCWLQEQTIEREACDTDHAFDLWLKVDGKARFNCTVNNQLDWTVEEYEWCCNEQGVGCLKQSDLSAKFEQQRQEEQSQNFSSRAWIALGGGLALGAAAMVALFLVAARSHQLPYQFLHRAGAPCSEPRRCAWRGGRKEQDSHRLLVVAPQDYEGAGVSGDFLEDVAGAERHRSHRTEEEAGPAYAYIFAEGKRVTLM
jgi:hypothetical protein